MVDDRNTASTAPSASSINGVSGTAVLATSVIGSFPKPEYLKELLPDWFAQGREAADASGKDQGRSIAETTRLLKEITPEGRGEKERALRRATEEVIRFQVSCGLHDVVTDGEVRRENYVTALCRNIEGIQFNNLKQYNLRGHADCQSALPTVCGKVSWKGSPAFSEDDESLTNVEGQVDVAAEWRVAQRIADKVAGEMLGGKKLWVKYTLPGPMTIVKHVPNEFYEKDEDLARDLAYIVRDRVKELVDAGCRYVQIDEPPFARQPERALAWGIDLLDICFAGVPEGVQREVHICCGYPEYLDDHDYEKAPLDSYLQLAPKLETSKAIDAVSLEDAHRHNDLSKLLPIFKTTKVILGLVKIANSAIEEQNAIETRIQEALKYIHPSLLIIAPDCGLGFLQEHMIRPKLTAMCGAARSCACRESKTKAGRGEEVPMECEEAVAS